MCLGSTIFAGFKWKAESDKVRGIYGAGNYMLTAPFSKFQVDSAQWHSWSKEQNHDHVRKFRNNCPTLADFYPKPKIFSQKPGYSNRERHEYPTVICNIIEEDREIHPAGNSDMSQMKDVKQGLSFSDPRQVLKKPLGCIWIKISLDWFKNLKVSVVKWSGRMTMECL